MSNATSDADTALPNASQSYAWQALGPSFIGYILQIFMTGVCCHSAARFFTKTSVLGRNMKIILALTTVLNIIATLSVIASTLLWGTTQKRDAESLWSYQITDAYAPLITGSVTTLVQGFFADRAWKVCNKSLFFLVPISICIIAAWAGSIGLGVTQILNMSGSSQDSELLLFTELMTWSAAAADIAISAVIIYGLASKRTGYQTTTDGFVAKIISAAMESAMITTTFGVACAITEAITWEGASGSYDLVFFIPLPSVYTFSLLWCLHTTNYVRREQSSQMRSIQLSGQNATSTGSCSKHRGSNFVGSPQFLLDQDPEKATELDFITGSDYVVSSDASAVEDPIAAGLGVTGGAGVMREGRLHPHSHSFSSMAPAKGSGVRTRSVGLDAADLEEDDDDDELLGPVPRRRNMGLGDFLAEDNAKHAEKMQ